MQMTDSDFSVNDWQRRLGGGGAGHYNEVRKDIFGTGLNLPAPLGTQ